MCLRTNGTNYFWCAGKEKNVSSHRPIPLSTECVISGRQQILLQRKRDGSAFRAQRLFYVLLTICFQMFAFCSVLLQVHVLVNLLFKSNPISLVTH